MLYDTAWRTISPSPTLFSTCTLTCQSPTNIINIHADNHVLACLALATSYLCGSNMCLAVHGYVPFFFYDVLVADYQRRRRQDDKLLRTSMGILGGMFVSAV
jgi:hypothetical protein